MYFPDGINLKGFIVFKAVCTHGTMAKAAKFLRMTQPAVSQHITKLENGLGALLIDRSSRPHKLTVEGQFLKGRLDDILNDISKTLASVKQINSGAMVNVRVSIPTSMSRSMNSMLCHYLKRRFKPECVRISFDKAIEMRRNLIHGCIDFALSTDSMEGIENLLNIPIWKEHYMLVLPKCYNGRTDSIQEVLRKLRFIHLNPESTMGKDVNMYLRRTKIEQKPEVVFDTPTAILEAIISGEGFSILTPMCLLEASLAVGQVKCEPLPVMSMNRTLSLVSLDVHPIDTFNGVADITKNVFQKEIIPRLSPLVNNNIASFSVIENNLARSI